MSYPAQQPNRYTNLIANALVSGAIGALLAVAIGAMLIGNRLTALEVKMDYMRTEVAQLRAIRQ